MGTRLGIDTGGTFTDFVVIDDESGESWTAKVPSTPEHPADAVANGLRSLANSTELAPERVVVGSTVATNAIIQRNGPRILFVTTEGFTDVPFIGRIDKERLYDLHWQKPKPLVERANSVGVGGRIDRDGVELEALDQAELDALGKRLSNAADEEETAIAVCLLFSYLNPEHERAVAAALRSALPEAPISVSHEVSPLWREYERSSTTIADAFVKPVVEQYVDGVGAVLEGEARVGRWNLLASNGGYLRADQARQRPVQLALSGLAGGVIGGAFHARSTGHGSAFTLDMGGTSCDIGLVDKGEQRYASEFRLAFGLPVNIPCVSVTTIGAGGGSIAWTDPGGLLRVGPRSAGAEPGPVAYGRGGTEPTVTDANLALGRLDPDYFLGGGMQLDPARADQALSALGERLDLEPVPLALAITSTADENMANAIRLVAVERGLDPRDFALIAFGGAGPLHARGVAKRLEMSTVLVPTRPGLCSAFGAGIAEARVDRLRTFSVRSTDVDVERLAGAERDLREEAVIDLRRSVEAPDPLLTRTAAMRYEGQNYELEVELPDGDLDRQGWLRLLERFERAHESQYGFSLSGEPVELVDLRVTARLDEPGPAMRPSRGDGSGEARRPVHFSTSGPVDCPILERGRLAVGAEVEGPAVIQEPDSTTLLSEGDRVRVLPDGVLELSVGSAE
jgi:N-methylhydantoinase A